jgi:alkanesulfonate monooxygenase SsuD/methylene tetrahydromethanopterin reductase-like flavin-dependent oxidoreductase (luciferase family)
MKFGIFYEHQLPRPWDEHSEYRLLHESLDQIELADRLGYHYAWEVEHHFLEEYSHSSAPEVFLGAASQRTTRIRLGHGIIQLTTNHPARVAERVSTLDLLSDGRVELGIGEGASTTELHPFGRRFRDKRAVWEEAVQALIPMFGDGRTEFHGTYFDLPARNVIPKPRQKPHPPLWVACSQRDTIEYCGRLGMGALGFQFVSADEAHAWVSAYYNSFTKRQTKLADYRTNPNIAVVSGFMCCLTDEEAHAKADGWTFFAFALRYYTSHVPGEPGTAENLWDEYQKFRRTPQFAKMHAGGLIGSPATIRSKLSKFAKSHVDQVILLNQAGRNRHEDICSSLELFAREVMPEFVEGEAEHQAWKEAVLGGDITLAEVDTTPEALARPTREPIETTVS